MERLRGMASSSGDWGGSRLGAADPLGPVAAFAPLAVDRQVRRLRRHALPGPVPRRQPREGARALTDEQVKEVLRLAVREGVLYGWYHHVPYRGREWVVNPGDAPCVEYDAPGIRAYCRALRQALS